MSSTFIDIAKGETVRKIGESLHNENILMLLFINNLDREGKDAIDFWMKLSRN